MNVRVIDSSTVGLNFGESIIQEDVVALVSIISAGMDPKYKPRFH